MGLGELHCMEAMRGLKESTLATAEAASGPAINLLRPVPGTKFRALPLLLTSLLLPVVTFIITYSISLTTKRNGSYLMPYPWYFLSVSIESKPASCIGTFGLCIACVCIPFVGFIRHAVVKKEIKALTGNVDSREKQSMRNLNTHSLKVVAVSAIGGIGVASFQSSQDVCGGTIGIVAVHFLFAFVFFVGGMYYCILQHRLDCKLPGLDDSMSRSLRKIFAYGTVIEFVCLIAVLIGAIIAFAANPSLYSNTKSGTNSSEDGSHEPRNRDDRLTNENSKTLIFVMSMFEISLLVTFMSTFFTFISSFRKLSFAVIVMEQGKKRYSLHEEEMVQTSRAD